MNFEDMPIIRLEVERLKSSVVSALGLRGSELGEMISKEVDKQVRSYDWEGHVKTIVHAAISEKIKSYFTYGEGAKKITAALDDAFSAGVEL